MTIKQFNGTYLAGEDRVLFRFNTEPQEEFRFWFTRRVTLFILVATSHLLSKKWGTVHSLEVTKAINEFEKETFLGTVKNENGSTPIYEAGLNFPLGFDPVLVMDITCTLTKDGEKLTQAAELNISEIGDVLSLDFILPGGANLNLKLPMHTLQAMCTLLDQLCIQAQWAGANVQLKDSSIENEGLSIKSSKNISIH